MRPVMLEAIRLNYIHMGSINRMVWQFIPHEPPITSLNNHLVTVIIGPQRTVQSPTFVAIVPKLVRFFEL